MPLHKNSIRQKRFTFVFIGTYLRQSNADSTSYLGIVQDFVTGVTDLSIDADVLPLTFGGVAGGTERVDNSEDNLDRWVINCMNHADDNHEYDAEDLRNSALAALNNVDWHDYSSGEDFEPNQLGSWQAEDEGNGRYDLAWIPAAENTAAFADDHPVGINQQRTVYLNVQDNFTPTEFTTDFSPITATLDEAANTVTLTASSASNMGSNIYWAVGRHFGINDNGTEIPQWIGTVTSRTTENDGSFTIVLNTDTTAGLVYLVDKVAGFVAGGGTENNVLQLFTTGRHFVVLEHSLYLYMLDQITTANLGYTVEGHCTEADINGSVLTGKNTETYNVLDVTVTSVNDSNGAFIEVFNISNDVLSGTTSEISQLRIRNNSGNNVTFGGARAFVNLPFIASETPLVRLTKAVAIMNSASVIDVVCTISGTDNNAVLRVVPRNTTVTWGTVSKSGAWGGSAAVSSTVPDIATSLSLVLDPNRIGTRTGITLIDDTYVSRTTDYGTLPNLTFARGSSLTLGNGFVLDIGKGYDFTGDAKDLIVTIEDNAILKVSGQAKENMWGNKFTRVDIDGTDTLVVIAPVATTANPVNVIQRTGGALVANFNPDLDAPVTGNRTFLYGRSQAQRDNSIIWTVDNGSTGIYNSKGIPFIYTMSGDKIGQTFVFNSPSSGTSTYVPSNGIKQFTGDTLYFGDSNANFQFSTAAFDNATIVADNIAFNYASQWIVIGMKLLGNVTDTLQAYNPVTNYLIIDVENDDGIYSGGWDFLTRPATSKGIATLARLWNPNWTYANSPLTGLIESYYYGTGSDEATLVAVKEGCEPNAINTVGTNNHPFDDAVTISDDYGLADAVINGAGINKYKSDNDGTTAGWGDSNSDRDGLALVFAQGTRPPESTSEGEGTNLTASVQDTDWFCYSRRDGYRPRIITEAFGNSLSAYQPVTPMEPFLDGYWQADTVSAIDAYTTKFLTSLYSLVPIYTLGTTLLDIYLPESETWNQIYRYLEHCENNGRITNANLASETRPFNVVNGRFDRFIDRTTQVTVDGAINMPNNNLKITVNGSLTRSTDSNALNGLDVGTTKTIDFHSVGSGSNVIEGDITGKGFTFTETFNTLSAQDSTFNTTDAQDYTIALSKTVVNSTGAPTFSDLTEEVTVNTDAKTTIDAATADMITNGNGAVEINANSNDGRYGTAVKKQSGISYSSSAVSTNDTGYASGDVTLPNSSTDAFINSGGDILRAGTTGITTDADLTATGSVTLNVVDGGNVTCGGLFRAHSSVTSTTIQATGNVTIDASATNSSGIGINGNAISILGNTIGCEVNAVTTFSTNDVTSGSDVSAGTSATMDVIDDSKVASPIVNCDYIQNSANVDATTSIDVDISMTGGTADSATINIDVDLTGGTATASGTLTVPLISGAQTTANAGTLVATTVSSGFINFSGNGSTVTNINGGIFGGTGNLTTTNRITGGSFGTNITLLSVPTNTSTTRHTGNYSDTEIEVTNSGIVEWDNSASGVATLTKGPASGTVVVRPGGVTMTIAADNGSNFTANIVLAELPFTVNITSPAGTFYRVKYGNTITAVQTGTLQLDEASLDRDEAVEIAAVRQGYAMVYQTFTVENLSEGGVQNVLINTNTVEAYPEADISGITTNGYVWDSDNQWVIFDFADIPQDNLAMNRIMTQLMSSNSATAGTTLDAILVHQDASWYRSGGIASGQFIDPTKVKVTSSTAATAATKETYPYYDIIGSTTDIYELTDLDIPLGQNTLRPGISIVEINTGLNGVLNTQFNARGVTETNIKNISDLEFDFDDTPQIVD